MGKRMIVDVQNHVLPVSVMGPSAEIADPRTSHPA